MNKDLTNIIDCFFVCAMLVNMTGDIVYINNHCDLFGYTQEELEHTNIQVFIPNNIKNKHLQYILNPEYHYKRTNSLNKHRSVMARKKNGDILKIHIIVHLLNLEDKNRFLIFCYDELPIISNTLTQVKNEINELQSLTHLGTWEFNVLADTIFLSDELKKMYSITKDTITLNESYSFIYPDDLNYVQTKFETAIQNKTSFNFLYRIYDIDKKLKYVNTQGILHFVNDDLYKITGTTIDITEQTYKEQELTNELKEMKQTVNYKTTLLNHISHEIKSPLTGILGICNILENSSLQPDQKECLHLLNDCVQILVRMLNDILDHSKLQNDQLNVICENFNINKLLNEVKLLYETFAVTKNNKIIVNINPNVPDIIIADPIRIKQVLNNLISNAIDFTDDGTITINVSIENEFLKFNIADTGCGIPDTIRDKLFTPLLSTSNYKYRKLGGSGLGLSICKNLVTLMKGDIYFESEINKGTTFYFTVKLRDN